jgi:hypothetical protein
MCVYIVHICMYIWYIVYIYKYNKPSCTLLLLLLGKLLESALNQNSEWQGIVLRVYDDWTGDSITVLA